LQELDNQLKIIEEWEREKNWQKSLGSMKTAQSV
jgi:hypothetical protein